SRSTTSGAGTDVPTLRHCIGGTWTAGSGASIDLVNPATERVIAQLPAGSSEDVDAAVGAAAEAQPAWAALSLEERLGHLERFADALEKHAAELSELECREMGKPV